MSEERKHVRIGASAERDALERALTMVLEPMGVRALGPVRRDEGCDGYAIRLAMPLMYIDVHLDRFELTGTGGQMRAYDRIGHCARVLFAGVVDHIAKHDRSPIDRTRDIETAATALLDAMHMPHGSSAAVVNAEYRLRALVSAKPGAAAWRKNGYGDDPPDVKIAPPTEAPR